jgi:hypothetical protein
MDAPLTNVRNVLRVGNLPRKVKNTVRHWPNRPPAWLRLLLNNPVIAYAVYLDALEWQSVAQQEPNHDHNSE